FIIENYGQDIVDFRMPKGSVVIYDTRLVHRAAPITQSGFERRSLFFQVERKSRGGEPILLNTSFADNLSSEQQYFLGFGAEPEYDVYPQTGLSTMRPRQLMELAIRSVGAWVRASGRSLAQRTSPTIRDRVRRFLRR